MHNFSLRLDLWPQNKWSGFGGAEASRLKPNDDPHRESEYKWQHEILFKIQLMRCILPPGSDVAQTQAKKAHQ